jgi:ribosomal protein S27AE
MRNKIYKTNNEIAKRHEIASTYSIKCGRCGHSVLVTNRYKRIICSWCGYYVFADKKDEFEYRLKEKMKNGKRNED